MISRIKMGQLVSVRMNDHLDRFLCFSRKVKSNPDVYIHNVVDKVLTVLSVTPRGRATVDVGLLVDDRVLYLIVDNYGRRAPRGVNPGFPLKAVSVS